jgi:geranylgeranyl diphosphate synthase, type I
MQAVGLEQLAALVDARLVAYFEAARARADTSSPAAGELMDAVAALTLRGGKRLRAMALYAGYCATCLADDLDPADVLDAAAALELLQSYFLIQDDWMDGDEQRRGGPAVHAALGAKHGDRKLGASLAILASDFASGSAWELIAGAPFPPGRLREALAAFGQMHFEVVAGQQLDMLAHPNVELMHQLKTGSYTVRGPLKLGALLADANDEQLAALERIGAPLGVAFQLRDDLLGTFGDQAEVGKPVGNDLRAGKRTALVAEARKTLNAEQTRALDQVLGNAAASDAEVAEATGMLLASGARERLEARAQALLAEADAVLTTSVFSPAGIALLRSLAERLIQRVS